eukprot:6123978-Pyramimonas_sp.AAC.1
MVRRWGHHPPGAATYQVPAQQQYPLGPAPGQTEPAALPRGRRSRRGDRFTKIPRNSAAASPAGVGTALTAAGRRAAWSR